MNTIQKIDLSTLKWQDSRARDCILRGGSKAGSYEYLHETQPHLRKHLPTDTHYLEYGENIENFLSRINFSKAKVVRGCHPLDFVGMVDVIPTEFIRGEETVRSTINQIHEVANSAEVRTFVEYEADKPYNGEIKILIQNECGSKRGSVIEHPHERGIYRISKTQAEGLDEFTLDNSCIKDGSIIDQGRSWFKNNIVFKNEEGFLKKCEASKVIALYEAVKDSGLIPEGYSFQMEYGIHNETGEIMFYQARLFKPFQNKADFDVKDIDNEIDLDVKTKMTYHYSVYGITPQSGIELNLAELNHNAIRKYLSVNQMAYACNSYGNHKGTPLDVMPKNLVAYLPYQPNVLEHGHYRWLQKANYGLISVRTSLAKVGFQPHESVQSLDEEVKIRVYSDGIRGLACLVE